MTYAWADVALFILLLGALWYALFRLYQWWATRRQRRENADIIRQIEDGLNKHKR